MLRAEIVTQNGVVQRMKEGHAASDVQCETNRLRVVDDDGYNIAFFAFPYSPNLLDCSCKTLYKEPKGMYWLMTISCGG